MSDIHPSIFDIVPSVARTVFNRFRNWTELGDIKQECYTFAASRNSKFKELLDEPDVNKRMANERRIAWQIKRAAERYARREKATRGGYSPADEAFYDTTIIAQLLPFVIDNILNGKPFEQAQIIVDDGAPKKQSVPAESGTFMAMLLDIKKAYLRLEVEEMQILERRYFDAWTLGQIAQYLEVSVSTADRRCSIAMSKLQENLGGDSPY